ncbi:MAG TPA: hypothetical protein VNA21_00280 [Steroidobacteraceae bacterium]|nr:hypothetical protein [Steroidobacteraceae bacterium]
MRFHVGLQQARSNESERRERIWSVVKAVVGSLMAGGAGLFFGFAMGLHDARWSDAWTQVGYASSPLSSASTDIRARHG